MRKRYIASSGPSKPQPRSPTPLTSAAVSRTSAVGSVSAGAGAPGAKAKNPLGALGRFGRLTSRALSSFPGRSGEHESEPMPPSPEVTTPTWRSFT